MAPRPNVPVPQDATGERPRVRERAMADLRAAPQPVPALPALPFTPASIPAQQSAQISTFLAQAGQKELPVDAAPLDGVALPAENGPDGPNTRHDPGSSPVRREAARSVPAQIVEALRKTPDGSVELRLSPEELGRVKMTVSPAADGGVSVSVLVERPETLELLRRHSDLLLADLKAEGFANPNLDFRQEGQARDDSPKEGAPVFGTEAAGGSAERPERGLAVQRPLPVMNGRTLDLRM